MKVAVVGLWHLGCVTAACLANAGHHVIAYDPNAETIAKLQQGKTPIFEPGLDNLLANGKLHYTAQTSDLSAAEMIWVTFDTPVDEHDVADVDAVMHEIIALFPHLQRDALMIISSQLPVGTTRKLLQHGSAQYPQKNIRFACSPENLRLGKAIEVFTHPDRVVVGIQSEADKAHIQQLLQSFTQNIVWMSIESAEMTKHAINAFLATSVVFINELATICEQVGADAREVERGLKTEERIGPKAYLRPGHAIAGGTLARDVNYLIQIGQQQQLPTTLFSALLDSNEAHKQWSCRRMLSVLKNLRDKKIATLGLTYKPGTDTLRRSTAIETCEWLNQQGAKVAAYDPAVIALPAHLANVIELHTRLDHALQDADAVVVTTEWQQFTTLTAEQLLAAVKQAIVFDASGFLMRALGSDARIRYYSVGR